MRKTSKGKTEKGRSRRISIRTSKMGDREFIKKYIEENGSRRTLRRGD